MDASKRPIDVLGVAWLFILVGAVGLVRHFPRPMVFHTDDVWILLTELLAVTAGAFMLRSSNWARWLAIVWMVFHVALSWPFVHQLVVHAVITILIAVLLFRRPSQQFFTSGCGPGSGTA